MANTIFKHEEIKAELLGSITKAVDGEFTDYCKDSRKSILLAKSPAEVGQFSNAKFLEECAVSCPFWTASRERAPKNPRWRPISERKGFSQMEPSVTVCKQANPTVTSEDVC